MATLAGWGVALTTITGITGSIVTDWEERREVSTEYLRNSAGKVIETEQYDEKTTVSCTVQVPATTNLTTDNTITVSNTKYRILTASVTESNTAYRKMTLSLEKYKDETIE